MKKEILKNNNGYTLIELIVSIAILSFAVVGFINLFVNSTSYIAQARQKSNTSAVVQTKANESIDSGTPAEGSETDYSITVDVTEMTIPDKNGNQSSEITAVLPWVKQSIMYSILSH